ncbi:MAG: calcium-binding protein [Candidatus Woesearchaeota archaeon]
MEKISKRKAKKLKLMAEEATVDCHNEDEQFSGWECTLNDELPLPLKCRIFDEEALLVRICMDESGRSILGTIKKGNKKIRIPIQDLKPASQKAAEWIEAYRIWLSC